MSKKELSPVIVEELRASLYPPEPREHNVGRLRRIHKAALNFSKVVAEELDGETRFDALSSIRQATRSAMIGIQTQKLTGKFFGSPNGGSIAASPDMMMNKAPIDRRGLSGGL